MEIHLTQVSPIITLIFEDVELIKNNAALGADIAVSLSQSNRLEETKENPIPMKKAARPITIIGGAAVDIISQSDTIEANSHNSHIGKIIMTEGGSTRNAAECIGRLG